MNAWINTITLEGQKVDLIPLQKSHRENLLKAANDGELWNIWYTLIPSEKTIDAYMETAFQEQANGKSLPFVVVNKEDGKIIGTTRYCNVESANRRLEIGATWYAKSFQRTVVKPNASTCCSDTLLKIWKP